MDFYTQFATDEKAEVEGVWVPVNPKARIKVARLGNPRHRECVRRKTALYKMAGSATTIPDEVWAQISREAVAETILVDWDGEGVTRDGKPVPYSKEEALKLICARKDFYQLVITLAENMDTFRVNGEAVLAKN